MTEASIFTDIGNTEVYIGTYGDKWIAATGHAPYLCLEADSVAALHDKLLRVIAFAKRAGEFVQGTGERDEPTTFVLQKKIKLRELEPA